MRRSLKKKLNKISYDATNKIDKLLYDKKGNYNKDLSEEEVEFLLVFSRIYSSFWDYVTIKEEVLNE